MENDSYARLLKAAKELKGARNEAAVALLLNISAQALHNWKKRGVPRRNLVEIEARIGAYATWIATGNGDMGTRMRDQSNDSLIIDIMNTMRFMSTEDTRFIAELCKRLSKERADAGIHQDTGKPRKRAPVKISARQTSAAVSPFWSGGRAVERRKIDNSEWYGINRRKHERRTTS